MHSITYYTLSGERDSSRGEMPLVFTGLMFKITNGGRTLLGRCTTLGSSVFLKETDKITKISITYHLTRHSQYLEEIIFEIKHSIKKGFRDTKTITDHKSQHHQPLSSSSKLKLSGIV